MGSFLGKATDTDNNFKAQSASISTQNLYPQLANSLGQFNSNFQNQGQLAGMLGAQAMGAGPNPALDQLKQTTDRGIAQNAGMLASQKGLSPALAARLAAQNGASMSQQAAGQAATQSAQQQLAAQGALGSLYGQMGNQSLGLQGTEQQAMASQNNAIVGNTSQMNQFNSGVASGNQQSHSSLVGGLLGGVGSAFGLAHGGVVPVQNKAAGGPISTVGQILTQQSQPRTQGQYVNPYASGFSQLGSGIHDALKSMFGPKQSTLPTSGPGSQEDMDSGGLLTLQDQQDEMNQSGLPLYQQQPQADVTPAAQDQPVMEANGGMMPDPAGTVPGKAEVSGDSLKNDKVPAMLSPKEIVLPRSITMHPNAPELAAEFVRRQLQKEPQKKSNFDDGGMIPLGLDPNRPVVEPQAVDVTEPNLSVPEVKPPPNPYAGVYQRTFEQQRKNNPGEPEEFSRQTALTVAEGLKRADSINKDSAVVNQQSAHDSAVEQNKRLAALGAPLLPVPPAPAVTQSGTPADGAPAALDQNATNPNFNAFNPMGLDAEMLKGMQNGFNEQKQGLFQGAKAQADLGSKDAAIAADQVKQQQQMSQDFKVKHQEFQQEYDNAMKDFADPKNNINPNHFVESLGTIGKVKTAIGLILGGLGSGLTKQENPAFKFLNAQIDRDIQGQMSNLGKKQSLLNANYQRLGNLRDATEMTRAMMMGIQANQFREAAAQAQGPAAKALALQHAGEIDEKASQMLGPIAMRQALMKNMGQGGGGVPPEMAIRYMAPQGQQESLMKDLKAAQSMVKQKDNLMNAFDQVNKLATVGSYASSPLQAPRRSNALVEPLLAQLIKDSEGRITPQDTEMMKGLFPRPGDDDATRRLRRMQLNKFVTEKLNFPSLSPYGFNPEGQGRYDGNGRDKLPPMAPPKR